MNINNQALTDKQMVALLKNPQYIIWRAIMSLKGFGHYLQIDRKVLEGKLIPFNIYKSKRKDWLK